MPFVGAALFPQFIDPSHAIAPQLMILGGTYLLVDGLTLVLWGAFAGRVLRRLPGLKLSHLNRLSGCLILGAAALLAIRG